jgi:hypothetical protein
LVRFDEADDDEAVVSVVSVVALASRVWVDAFFAADFDGPEDRRVDRSPGPVRLPSGN